MFSDFCGKTIELQDITDRLIERYKVWRREHSFIVIKSAKEISKKELSNRTINRDLMFIKQSIQKAIKWKFLNNTPLEEIAFLPETKGRVRFFSLEEIEAILSKANLYNERFFLFGINTGMRKSEILSIRIKDIDLANNLIHIFNREDFQTKSRRDRSLPIPRAFKEKLIEYINFWADPYDYKILPRTHAQKEYLFCKKKGTPIQDFKTSFNTLLKTAKVFNASIHTMRHTYASHLAINGVPLKTIQELLGHSDMETTLIYAHLSPEHKQREVNKLSFNVSLSSSDKEILNSNALMAPSAHQIVILNSQI